MVASGTIISKSVRETSLEASRAKTISYQRRPCGAKCHCHKARLVNCEVTSLMVALINESRQLDWPLQTAVCSCKARMSDE